MSVFLTISCRFLYSSQAWLGAGALALGIIVAPGLPDVELPQVPTLSMSKSSGGAKPAAPKKEVVKKQSMAKKKLKDTSGYDLSGL